MNNDQLTCDPRRIELFLHQQLSDEEQTAFELHLDNCQECRQRLETTAAGDDIWSAVRDSLHGQQLPPDEAHLADSALDAPTEGEAPFGHGTVLKLLAPSDDDRMIGRLGTYEVAGVVGSGGMGVVLKAFDTALHRYVAIKVLAPHLGSSGAARKRFSREAQAAAAVVHDNVIEIHGVADTNGLPYLVMPYVRGPSLQRRLDDEGPLALAEILRIGMQAASGLAAAHAQGLVHRDVKPANILLADGIERVKLTDFGLARAADDASLTKTGIIAGTPQYMSPEQARGEAVDQPSDLFSLGSVLYAMCTGRAPFRAETSYGILRRITDDEPRPIRQINPDTPEWLCQIIARLMSKRPEDRFQSADEVAELLEECLAHVQQPSSVPMPKRCVALCEEGQKDKLPAARTETNARRRRVLKRLAGAALALAMICAGALIVLELNKGKLTIKSDVGDVPVRITQGDKVVEKLTTSLTAASVRIAAGQYTVEIDGGPHGLTIQNGTVNLPRGGSAVVRIVKKEQGTPGQPRASIDAAPPYDQLSGYRDSLWGSLRSLEHDRDHYLAAITATERSLLGLQQPIEMPADADPKTKERLRRDKLRRASKIAQTSARLKALREELAPVEPQIAFVKKKLVELPAPGATNHVALDAEIVAVSDGQVNISAGSDDGVLKGLRIPVFHENKHLGDIQVVKVDTDKSTARILNQDAQSAIGRGDRAVLLVDAPVSRIIGSDPGQPIYNDRLKRFKFRLEKIDVTSAAETAEWFWNMYRDHGHPPLAGVWGDPRTNSLVVVGPPEADQAIRDTIAKSEGELIGIDLEEDSSLEAQQRDLQNRRRRALEQVARLKMEIIAAQAREEPDADTLQQLDRDLKSETDRLEIAERQLHVLRDSIARLQADAGPDGDAGEKVAAAFDSASSESIHVSGKAVDEQGSPIAKVTILAVQKTWPNGRYRQQMRSTTTDANGNFAFKEFAQPGGQYAFLLTVVSDRWLMTSEYRVVRDGKQQDPITLETANAEPVTFRFRDPAGKPVADVGVLPARRTSQDGKEYLSYAQQVLQSGVPTDGQGEVRFGSWKPGERGAIVYLANDRIQTFEFSVPENRMVTVAIDAPRPKLASESSVDVSGKVVDAAGKPLAGVAVLAVRKTWPNNRYRQEALATKSGADGTFRFDEFALSGRQYAFLVTVIPDGYSMTSKYVLVRDGEQREPVTLTVVKAEPVTFVIQNADGKPLEGVEISPSERIVDPSTTFLNYSMHMKSSSKKSDAKGQVSFTAWKPGETGTLYYRYKDKLGELNFEVGRGRRVIIRLPVGS